MCGKRARDPWFQTCDPVFCFLFKSNVTFLKTEAHTVLTSSVALTPDSPYLQSGYLGRAVPPALPAWCTPGAGMQEPGVWAGFVWWLREGRMSTG